MVNYPHQISRNSITLVLAIVALFFANLAWGSVSIPLRDPTNPVLVLHQSQLLPQKHIGLLNKV